MRDRGSARKIARSAVLVVIAAGAVSLAAGSSFELRHGVIVDSHRGVAYAGGPNGGIEAIDLSNGRSVWTSSEAALPLALQGTLLAAQAEEAKPGPRLRLAVLNAVDGRNIAEAVTDLPGEVRAIVSDRLGESFRARATADAGGFLVTWSYRNRTMEGVAPEPGQLPAERKLSGTTRISVPRRWAQHDSRRSRSSSRCRADLAEQLMKRDALPHPPWRAGSVLAIALAAPGEPVRLKRWNACSGRALPERILAKNSLVAFASADRAHLLVSNRTGTGGVGDPEYQWSIFSLETGEKIGEARRDVSAARFFVWNDTIVFESMPRGFRRGDQWIDVPLELVAIRLTGNEQGWHRAIRDLEYRGPTPPAP